VILDNSPERFAFELSSGSEMRRIEVWRSGRRPQGSKPANGQPSSSALPVNGKAAVIANLARN